MPIFSIMKVAFSLADATPILYRDLFFKIKSSTPGIKLTLLIELIYCKKKSFFFFNILFFNSVPIG